MNIALGILFFTLSNVNIDFVDHHIYWKMYTIAEVLLTIKRVELIKKKEFATVVLDPGDGPFVVHLASISQDLDVHLSWKAHIALLKADKAPTFILSKYANFANIFFKKLAAKLLEHIRIHKYSINLIKGQ